MIGSDSDNFKKKRQEFSTNLRKTNRENILMKRRNIETAELSNTGNNEKKNKIFILDEGMRTYLTKIMQKSCSQQDLPRLMQICESKDILEKHWAAYCLRVLSFNQESGPSTAEAIINHNKLGMLMNWYNQEQYLQIKFEALWIIANIVSYSLEAGEGLVSKGIIENISKDLVHSNSLIKFRAIWAVGNFSADSPKHRDQLISLGSVIKIIKYLEEDRTSDQIVTSIWALTNLARGRPPPKYDAVKHVIPSIAEALKRNNIFKNEQILSDCLWTIANLSEGPKVRIQRILQTGVIPNVMPYLRSSSLSLSVPALRIVGNFTSGNKDHTNQILKNKFLDQSLLLLEHEKDILVKETCWALSNITAGSDEQILQFLHRPDLVHKLVNIYPTKTNEIKTQIIWIFTNLERSDIPDVIMKFMKELGLIKMIGQLLKQQQQRCILDALTCLNRVLVMGQRCQQTQINEFVKDFINFGYLPILESYYHASLSPNIERQSKKILTRFFDTVSVDQMIDA